MWCGGTMSGTQRRVGLRHTNKIQEIALPVITVDCASQNAAKAAWQFLEQSASIRKANIKRTIVLS